MRGLGSIEGCQAAVQEEREEVRGMATQRAEEGVECWFQRQIHGRGDSCFC